MKEALYILGEIVHTLQKERGCSAIFLYSDGELFEERLQQQYTKSDTAIKSTQEGWGRWGKTHALKEAQLQKLRKLLDICNELPKKRNEVIAQKLSASATIAHYSHQIISPLLQLMAEIALHIEGHNPVLVSTYNAFLQWKERIGLERAIGVRGFVKHSFQNDEFLERILFLLSEQRSYRRTCMALADGKQKALMEGVLKTDASVRLKQLHTLLRSDPESKALNHITPEEWFDLITEKMDALQAIEREMVNTLSNEGDPETIREEEPRGHSLGKHDKLIRSLPLFSGLSPKNLDALLQHGQVREFHKGKLLFLEREQANRLYIILRGWVKLFKGTASGEETVLQMLSASDSIMESAVFLNAPFPVSAQIIEDATILSLPAPVLREQIKNNSELAMNLLATMSHRSQGLIHQIENARLKSADERIGWFLLKLLLDQGHISRSVELPYDKSLIASYLDMKRETFSRALKRLKDKGFKIENDTVIIPDLKSLCDFCDTGTAAMCKLHGTSDCPNPDCDEPQAARIR